MRAALVLVLPLMLIGHPARGHCYSVWKYPTPQHCRGVYNRVSPEHISYSPVRPLPVPPDRPVDVDIPLPDLTDATWNIALDTPEQLELMQSMQRQRALRTLEEERTK